MGFVFSLPLRYLCLPSIIYVFLDRLLLGVAFCDETQHPKSAEWDGEFCKVHVLCCVGHLLIAATSSAFLCHNSHPANVMCQCHKSFHALK